MPVFRSPDGIEFSSKSEYREYMMNNFYSIKNKANEHLKFNEEAPTLK